MKKQESTSLGRIIGVVGFITGFVVGWNVSQNGWFALLVGFIFWAIGVAVGNLITKILVIAVYIALAFGTAYIRHAVFDAVTNAPARSTQSQSIGASQN
jgi:hypothetical protein